VHEWARVRLELRRELHGRARSVSQRAAGVQRACPKRAGFE
jgi:hypothetical protein